MTEDKENLEEFLNPNKCENTFAVLNTNDELVVFYSYYFKKDIMWISFGLKPELTPENDKWTDLSLNKLTFDKFNIDKEIKILENAGHFPIEEPGTTKLYKSTCQFIQNIDKEKGDD